MGKKRIITKTEEELLKEKEKIEAAVKKEKEIKKGFLKGIFKGRAFITATYNNVIITLTDEKGDVLAWSSSGSIGFKGARKATPYAASRVGEAIAEKAKKIGLRDLSVFVKGIGSGRDSAIRALSNFGINIISIKDVTPIPHGGCRPKKVRRV